VGDVLYRLDSARWRQLQEELVGAEAQRDGAAARLDSMGPLLDAHRQHRASLESKVALWESRMAQLERIREAGGGQRSEFTQAQASLREAQAELADVVEKMAELEAQRRTSEADAHAARGRLDLLTAGAAILTGLSVEQLAEPIEEKGIQRPRWRAMGVIEVRAVADGVVETLAARPGAFVESAALVVSVVQPEAVRFRAKLPQADLGRVSAGLRARLVPPSGGAVGLNEGVEGTVEVALVADADQRTIDIMAAPAAAAAWTRAGVSGFLELTLAGGSDELAIPQSCVVRDGLTAVFFRRDPKDADQVIRMEGDLGVSDGRWVTVLSGVREGDEIVMDGAYPLLLATSGSTPKGGHFHSDGTFHEGGQDGKEEGH
jgi:multidrug resistance efflux pump